MYGYTMADLESVGLDRSEEDLEKASSVELGLKWSRAPERLVPIPQWEPHDCESPDSGALCTASVSPAQWGCSGSAADKMFFDDEDSGGVR